ncbi:Plasmid stabilization system protein ParE [Ruegeria intermedia]|uniref:Plasmid stabilization system protein ParE n=1 Tax=Ruegeria intermedia TaxID=996115 RepID=A0A1M5B940_9RHOB|nr:type II toxin-antitoxin system RelE/ParE family toxin [Ruegeria intermedia]SHF39043.1 Plasmid stabilization system protein ParE [Ruegeria intermedia]
MSYRLRYHPAVAQDLITIAELIADYAGPNVARDKLARIADTAQSLTEQPHRGSLRDHILPGLRAIPAARRAVIAFTIDEDRREVHVLSITYGGADWMGRIGRRG